MGAEWRRGAIPPCLVNRAVCELNFDKQPPTLEHAPDICTAAPAVIGSDAMEWFLVVALPPTSESGYTPARSRLAGAFAVLEAEISPAISD
jgi:hypothetical protein